jgi:hypothetical protein
MASKLDVGSLVTTGNVLVGSGGAGADNLEIYDDDGSGNTTILVHNDSTANAAVLRLEGGRTSDNDSSQIIFGNTGNVCSAIRNYRPGANDAGELRFYTSLSGTGDGLAEAMRFSTAGLATFANGINLGNSTLSNYTEGVQVVTMTAASGTITLNGAVNTAQYTRIGRMVYYSGQLSVSSVSSPTGAIRITLPYTVGDTTDNAERSCGVCYVTGASSNNGNGVLLVDGGNTTAGIVVGVATNPVMQASAEIYFSISYIAA